jgi:hypothetical protein
MKTKQYRSQYPMRAFAQGAIYIVRRALDDYIRNPNKINLEDLMAVKAYMDMVFTDIFIEIGSKVDDELIERKAEDMWNDFIEGRRSDYTTMDYNDRDT